MKANKRHEIRYWPRYQADNTEKAFPKYFLIGCFLFLFLWIGIAYYFKY